MFWLGPCVGGVVAALVFEVIFITHRRKSRSEISVDGGKRYCCCYSILFEVRSSNPYLAKLL